jgi:hypothetical protein
LGVKFCPITILLIATHGLKIVFPLLSEKLHIEK